MGGSSWKSRRPTFSQVGWYLTAWWTRGYCELFVPVLEESSCWLVSGRRWLPTAWRIEGKAAFLSSLPERGSSSKSNCPMFSRVGWSLTTWWIGGYCELFLSVTEESSCWPVSGVHWPLTAWWIEGLDGFFSSPPKGECSLEIRWNMSSGVCWSLTAWWIGGYFRLFVPVPDESSCWPDSGVRRSLTAWWIEG